MHAGARLAGVAGAAVELGGHVAGRTAEHAALLELSTPVAGDGQARGAGLEVERIGPPGAARPAEPVAIQLAEPIAALPLAAVTGGAMERGGAGEEPAQAGFVALERPETVTPLRLVLVTRLLIELDRAHEVARRALPPLVEPGEADAARWIAGGAGAAEQRRGQTGIPGQDEPIEQVLRGADAVLGHGRRGGAGAHARLLMQGGRDLAGRERPARHGASGAGR
jgi:hypothetical protein